MYQCIPRSFSTAQPQQRLGTKSRNGIPYVLQLKVNPVYSQTQKILSVWPCDNRHFLSTLSPSESPEGLYHTYTGYFVLAAAGAFHTFVPPAGVFNTFVPPVHQHSSSHMWQQGVGVGNVLQLKVNTSTHRGGNDCCAGDAAVVTYTYGVWFLVGSCPIGRHDQSTTCPSETQKEVYIIRV